MHLTEDFPISSRLIRKTFRDEQKMNPKYMEIVSPNPTRFQLWFGQQNKCVRMEKKLSQTYRSNMAVWVKKDKNKNFARVLPSNKWVINMQNVQVKTVATISNNLFKISSTKQFIQTKTL